MNIVTPSLHGPVNPEIYEGQCFPVQYFRIAKRSGLTSGFTIPPLAVLPMESVTIEPGDANSSNATAFKKLYRSEYYQ